MLITLIPREGTETQRWLRLAVPAWLITLIPREGTETLNPLTTLTFPARQRVDYPYSPRGDGNYNASGEILAEFRKLITLIPREGTETRSIAV